MPRLSVWMLRAALLYLSAGFTFGALLLAHKGVPFAPWLWQLLPAHIDFLLVGFVIQLAAGTAFWILPRYRVEQRGNPLLAWLSFGLLNAGILAVGAQAAFGLPSAWLLAGRTAEALSALLFVAYAWRRVKPSGT